jgi:hypothetical protein
VALLTAAVGCFIFVVARIRMARYLLKLQHPEWDISTPSVRDATSRELFLHMDRLLYPPRLLHLCSEGILIEGWLYVMPLPFQAVQAVEPVKKGERWMMRLMGSERLWAMCRFMFLT